MRQLTAEENRLINSINQEKAAGNEEVSGFEEQRAAV